MTAIPSGRTETPRRPKIIVGVDGSDDSRRALAWALAEADLRNADLHVVIAWAFPYAWGRGFNSEWADDADFFAKAAEKEAEEAVAELLGSAARPTWLHVHAFEGSPAPVLLDLSRDADLLVVGSRGRGGFRGLMLGSVSSACARHASCPIAVIPAAEDRSK